MATLPPRGRGGSRGGRGRGTPYRGVSTPRGNFAGARDSRSPPASAPIGLRGGHNGGFRGGAQRGGTYTRGDNSRGQGDRTNSPSRSSTAIKNSTPHPDASYKQRLEYLREDRPRQRTQLIKERRMNPDGPMQLSQAVKLIGICNDMCPEFERVRRIVEDDYKPAECTPETAHGDRKLRVPDESRMVKAYTRSAAGMETELVTDIRSPSACLKTMKHMSSRLDSDELPFLYGWLWDRTRAVRKDLRTQAVDKPDEIAIYLECFEQCARLLLLCLHHMSGITSQDYDHQQDVEQLMQTATSLKERYSDNRSAKIVSANEAEFLAYRLVLSLHNNDSLIEYEVQRLPEKLQRNGRVKVALRIYQAGKIVLHKRSRKLIEARQNWKDFWVLIQSPAVSYLMACASEILFNQVRRTVLDTLYRAYRQGTFARPVKMEDWTLAELIQVLGFDTSKQVIGFCQAYGFKFGTSAAGEEFLDINSLPYSTGPLQDPAEMTPQFFSQFVESKRHCRNLSAVIQGMSVKLALSKGLVVESNHNVVGVEPEQNSDEDSLFIPDNSAAKPIDFNAVNANSELQNGPSTSASMPKFNPFAPSFQPTTTPTSAFNTGITTPSNPFLTSSQTPTASTTPFGTPSGSTFGPSGNVNVNGTGNISGPKFSAFGTPTGPSFFKPNGTTTEAPKSGFGLPSGSQQSTASPFAPKPTTTTSPATGQTVQPGLFDASKNGIKFNTAPNGASPFPSFNSGSPFASAASTPADAALTQASEQPSFQSNNPFAITDTPATDEKPKVASTAAPALPAFTAPSSTAQEPATSLFPQAPSSTSTAFPSFSQAPIGLGTNQQQPTSKEEDQQRAEREQKERDAKAAQDAAARLAKEEEAQRRAKEALQRTRREKEERERQAHQQQLALQQQQLALQQQRAERIRSKKEAILTAVADDFVNDPVEGLLQQYIDHQVERIYDEVAPRLRWERLTRYADEMYHQKQVARARYYFARWVAMTHKRKRNNKARERRRWLKQNAAVLLALNNEANTNRTNGIAAIEDQSRTELAIEAPPKTTHKSAKHSRTMKPADQMKVAPANFRKPEAPASATLRTRRVSKPTSVVRAPCAANKSKHTKAASQGSKMILYKNHNAPIDRTHTDWFKMRAAGLDPSKHRKRSFGSASDDQEQEEADRKRLRRSTSSAIPTPPTHRTPLPPPTTDEERLARFRAVRESFGKPSTPVSIRTTRPLSGTASLIAKARQFTSTPKGSPPNMQHDFSRSVPDLHLGASNGSLSAFGASVDTSAGSSRPAYWARQSRFVPQHLYGKGSEAVLEYRRQFRTSTGSSTSVSVEPQENLGPLQLSSPFQTQQSYAPEQFLESFDSEDVSGTGDDMEDEVEGEDEDMFEYEDEEDEENEEGEEDEEDEVDYGAYTQTEYGYGEQEAQHVSGATQNAPIELSDSD